MEINNQKEAGQIKPITSSVEEAFLYEYLGIETQEDAENWVHAPFLPIESGLFQFMRAYMDYMRRNCVPTGSYEEVSALREAIESVQPTPEMERAADLYLGHVGNVADMQFIRADFLAGMRYATGKTIASGLHGIPTHTKYADGTPVRVGDKCHYENDTVFTVVFEGNAIRKRYEGWDESLPLPLLEGHEADSYGAIRKIITSQD